MGISSHSSAACQSSDDLRTPQSAVRERPSVFVDGFNSVAESALVAPARTAGAKLRCEVVTDFLRLEELAPEWDRLWRADPKAEIFQSFTWAHVWWQTFGGGLNLCTPVIYEGDNLLLILPLVQCGDSIRFLGAPQSDYSDVLCSETRVVELLGLALNALLAIPGWKKCVFQDLSPHGRIVTHWHQLPSELRKLLQLEPANQCPTILFAGKRAETLDPLLGKKHLRRRQNKLEKAGCVSFRHIENRSEAQEQLTQFFQCHRRRCALVAKTSVFEQPQMCQFLRVLMEQMDLRNELRFGVIELDGWPLAWSLGFHVNGKFVYYQQTFDLDAADYAPGEVLLYYLLLYAKNNVDFEFDFARGDEFFKSRFSTHTLQSWNLHLERPGARGRLRRLSRSARGQCRHWQDRIEGAVRNHEAAFHAFRSLRISKKNALTKWRQAQQSGTLAQYFLDYFVNFLRTALWAKQDITLFQIAPDRLAEAASPPANRQIEIGAASFNDLVDLSLDYPGMMPIGLPECRDRLKKGDRAYLVRHDGRIVLAAWAGTRDISTLLMSDTIKTGAHIMTLYDCWSLPGFDSAACYQQLLPVLIQEARSANNDLIACCSKRQSYLRAELESQGFQPKYRLARYRVFHWIRRDSFMACMSPMATTSGN
jgi:CelD/BcsL family acetyltransferase involved in cellulose biosynthesis